MSQEREKRPSSSAWKGPKRTELPVAGVIASSGWVNGSTIVISTLEMAKLPDGSGVGPQWHLSVSVNGRRARGHEVRHVLRDFGMVGAEEDNHHPGIARNFWIPLDPSKRVECECKTNEDIIREPDGYTWTNPKEETACRGCELAMLVWRPCPIHHTLRAGAL